MSVKDRVLQAINGRIKPKPFPGEQRTFRKILWFPKKLPVSSTNGLEEWRWGTVEYIRCVYWGDDPMGKLYGPWEELYFVD